MSTSEYSLQERENQERIGGRELFQRDLRQNKKRWGRRGSKSESSVNRKIYENAKNNSIIIRSGDD